MCGAISGQLKRSTVSGCNANTDASGTVSALLGGSKATISWASGKKTTFTTTYRTGHEAACPRHKSEYIVTGNVTADTTGSTQVGATVKMRICVKPASLRVSPVPGVASFAAAS